MRSSAGSTRWAASVAGLRARRPRRRAVARLDLRHLPLLPQRAGESLRRRRASPATRSTAAMPTHTVADARYCFPLPRGLQRRGSGAAALRRADRLPLAEDGRRRQRVSASTASAPRPISWRRWRGAQGRRVFAFTRPGDARAQDFARELGAAWAGGSDETPPETLDAAIIFAPVGRARAGGAEGRHARAASWSAAASI